MSPELMEVDPGVFSWGGNLVWTRFLKEATSLGEGDIG